MTLKLIITQALELVSETARRRMAVCLTVVLLGACSSTLEEREEKGKAFPLPEYNDEVKVKTKWRRSIGSGQGGRDAKLAPVKSGDRLCGASYDGVVACYDLEGKKLWRVKLKDTILAATGIDQIAVYVVNADGWLIALAREDGNEMWRKALESEVLAAPVVSGERIIIQNSEGIVRGLSLQGELAWEYKSDAPLLTLRGTATPVIRNGVVYCGFGNGKIVALSLLTGEPLWDQPVAIASGTAEIERLVDVDASPLVTDRAVYAASYNGNIFKFDRARGVPQWRTELSTYRGLDQGFTNVYAVDENSRVLGFDAENGDQRWENSLLLNRGLSDPVVFAGYVIAIDDEGYLHVFSQVDGKLVGRSRIGGKGVRVSAIPDSDSLYVYTNSGDLVSLALTVR